VVVKIDPEPANTTLDKALSVSDITEPLISVAIMDREKPSEEVCTVYISIYYIYVYA
jgi:hypothetical protein